MERIVCLAIGYVFGLFQTAFMYGKMHGIDIREHGSGNAGTTNALRTLGWKAGAITFIGDCLKCVLAVLLVRFIFADSSHVELLAIYAGLGAVLGHNFPFYLRFRGGKGIASTLGVVLVVCPQAIPVCLSVFLLCLWLSKYVSLGSILMSILLMIQVLLFNAYGILGVEGIAVWEFNALMLVFTVMAIIRHRANIVRLAKGTENKIGKKPEENKTK